MQINFDTYGFKIEFIVPFELTGATGVEIEIEEGRSYTARRPAIIADAEERRLAWVVGEGDFPKPGFYKLQAIVDFPDARLRSKEFGLTVA